MSKQRKLSVFLPIAALAILCLVPWQSSLGGDDEGPLISAGGKLIYPALDWTRSFPLDINDVAVARKSGQVVVSTDSDVYYFDGNAKAKWTAGDKKGWKYVADLGISWDGGRVLFQTDDKKKTTTEAVTFTTRMYDGEGKEILAKPNPYRYERARLSPSGNYIMMGETMHKGTKVFDNNLNLLWEKNMEYWYLAFDPLERYVFDGEGGILYTIKGEQVWDFGRYTRILSVSDNAEFVMTTFYRTIGANAKMSLIGRLALKKIELPGLGGCVSPDGTFTAYVNADKKLVVYRTRELLGAGADNLPPLFETSFQRPWSINLARDNKSLFVMGAENSVASSMMLIDLTTMKIAWKKKVGNDLRIALPTDNNEQVAVQAEARSIKVFKCY